MEWVRGQVGRLAIKKLLCYYCATTALLRNYAKAADDQRWESDKGKRRK